MSWFLPNIFLSSFLLLSALAFAGEPARQGVESSGCHLQAASHSRLVTARNHSPEEIAKRASNGGYFEPATKSEEAALVQAFIDSKLELDGDRGKWRHEITGEVGPSKWTTRKVRRIREEDFLAWTLAASPTETSRAKLRKLALERIKVPTPDSGLADLEKIRRFGYTGFYPYLFYTSGAGSWSRGARQVKALVPLNLHSVLGPRWRELQMLFTYMISGRKERGELTALAHRNDSPYAPILARGVYAVDEKAQEIVEAGRLHSNALTPFEMKLALAAVTSAVTGKYQHFKMLTSGTSHKRLQQARDEFSATYKKKIFVEDTLGNSRVHDAIERYLKASDALGEGFLLGYQIEHYPLNVLSNPIQIEEEEDANGIGAGTGLEALLRSGVAEVMQRRGVHHWKFENVEVQSMHPIEQYGAHLGLGVDLSAILVPETQKFRGGYGFVDYTDNHRQLLIEGVGLPEYLKCPDPSAIGFFNSNTLFGNMSQLIQPTELDWEIRMGRHGHYIVLPKLSLGVLTEKLHTRFIRGAMGYDYQNLKTYADYEQYGDGVVTDYRQSLAQLLAQSI